MPIFTNTRGSTGQAGGFKFTWSITGQQQVERELGRLVEKSTSFRELWLSQEFKDIIYGGEKAQFASEGAHGSGGWAALSPDYAAWKAKVAPGQPILQLTGALWRSLTDPNASGAVYAASNRSLTFGTQVPYAIFHQTGAPEVNLPQRRPIQFTDGERQQIMKALQTYLFHTQRPAIRRHYKG